MSLAKRFTLSMYWNFIGKFVFSVIALLISIIIARKLNKDDLGIYASIVTFPVVLRLFTSFGFETILNVFLPTQDALPEGKEKIRFLVKRLLLLRILVIISVSIILFWGREFLSQFIKNYDFSEHYLIILLYLAALLLSSYSNMILRAVMRIKLVSILECLAQILNILFLIVFFSYTHSVYVPLLAFIVASIIITIISLYVAREYISGKSIPSDTRQFVNIGFTGFMSSVLVFGLGRQIDILIMNYFGIPNSNIGYYYLSFSFATMIGVLLQGIGPLSQSVFSQKYMTEGKKGLAISWEMVTKVSIILSVPLYVFALVFAKDILVAFYGETYVEAAGLLRIIAIFITLSILTGNSFCMPVCYLTNRKAAGLKIIFFSGMINLILDIILIPRYGVMGAIYATGLSSLLQGLVMVQLVIRTIKVRFPIVFCCKVIAISFLAIMPALVFEGANVLPMIILKAFIYFAGFILLAMVVKPLGNDEKSFVKRVNNRLYAVVKYF